MFSSLYYTVLPVDTIVQERYMRYQGLVSGSVDFELLVDVETGNSIFGYAGGTRGKQILKQ